MPSPRIPTRLAAQRRSFAGVQCIWRPDPSTTPTDAPVIREERAMVWSKLQGTREGIYLRRWLGKVQQPQPHHRRLSLSRNGHRTS